MSIQQQNLVKDTFKQPVALYFTCSLSCKLHTIVTYVSKTKTAGSCLCSVLIYDYAEKGEK